MFKYQSFMVKTYMYNIPPLSSFCIPNCLVAAVSLRRLVGRKRWNARPAVPGRTLNLFSIKTLSSFRILKSFSGKGAFRVKGACRAVGYNKNISAITKAPNTTLAMPFAVIKAMLTLLRSLGFTMLCWYISMPKKTAMPTQ